MIWIVLFCHKRNFMTASIKRNYYGLIAIYQRECHPYKGGC